MKNFNGLRLKEARLYNKMTITELAKRLDVSKQMISKYENCISEPSYEKSLHLFEVLNFPREFFYTEDNYTFKTEGTFFRSRLTATQKSKVPASYMLKYAVLIRDYFENYVEFPALHDRSVYEDTNDPEEIAMRLRQILQIGEKPIADIIETAELLGMTVVQFSYDEDRVDAFSSMCEVNGNEYFILATGEPRSFYRQQFSIAHEIGHWVLHQGIDAQELEREEYRVLESEANDFAAELLLPRSAFIKDVKYHGTTLDSFLILKQKWNVSIAAMVLRATQLGLISTEEQTKFYKQMNYRGIRNPEPLDLKTKITEPVALKQAIELLIDEGVKQGHEIRNEIAHKYNLFLTKSVLARVCNVPESIFSSNGDSKVVVRIKDFKMSDENKH